MRSCYLLLIIGLISIKLQSQNRIEFFKTVPIIDTDTPNWAKLMYSDNPNVGEVQDLYSAYSVSYTHLTLPTLLLV